MTFEISIFYIIVFIIIGSSCLIFYILERNHMIHYSRCRMEILSESLMYLNHFYRSSADVEVASISSNYQSLNEQLSIFKTLSKTHLTGEQIFWHIIELINLKNIGVTKVLMVVPSDIFYASEYDIKECLSFIRKIKKALSKIEEGKWSLHIAVKESKLSFSLLEAP